jgi:uncharacterized protein YuzE
VTFRHAGVGITTLTRYWGMPILRLTHDTQTDAAYIYLAVIGAGESVRQEVTESGFTLDFDSEDRLVGFEVLDATRRLSSHLLAEASPP